MVCFSHFPCSERLFDFASPCDLRTYPRTGRFAEVCDQGYVGETCGSCAEGYLLVGATCQRLVIISPPAEVTQKYGSAFVTTSSGREQDGRGEALGKSFKKEKGLLWVAEMRVLKIKLDYCNPLNYIS